MGVRGIYAVLSLLLLALAGYVTWIGFTQHNYGGAFGDDLSIYTGATVRLFSGGDWFLERQVAPYVLRQGDVLYPPTAAWFFLPFVVLGPTVFLVAGVGLLAWLVWSWRPAPWAWPLLALCLVLPTSFLKPWSGNPSLWVAVAVGLGLRYGVGALVLLKPTFLPFALAGIRTRAWWSSAAVLALLTLPFLGETLLYPSVILNARGPLASIGYSLWDWPLALIPVIASVAAPDGPLAVAVVRRRAAVAVEPRHDEGGIRRDDGDGLGVVRR